MVTIQEDKKKGLRVFKKSWLSTPSKIQWTFVPESLPDVKSDQVKRNKGEKDGSS